MKIVINNKETITEAHNLGELTSELNLPSKGVAVAIANRMIPRAEWDTTILEEGSNIVIIKAACGG